MSNSNHGACAIMDWAIYGIMILILAIIVWMITNVIEYCVGRSIAYIVGCQLTIIVIGICTGMGMGMGIYQYLN